MPWKVFAEDTGTGLVDQSDRDYADGAHLAALSHIPNATAFAPLSPSITADYTNLNADLTEAQYRIEASSVSGRDHGNGAITWPEVTFGVYAPAATISLTDSAVNHVFVAVNLGGTGDDGRYVVNTDGTTPTDPHLKIAEIDTSANTVTQFNQKPDGTFDSLNSSTLSAPSSGPVSVQNTDFEVGGTKHLHIATPAGSGSSPKAFDLQFGDGTGWHSSITANGTELTRWNESGLVEVLNARLALDDNIEAKSGNKLDIMTSGGGSDHVGLYDTANSNRLLKVNEGGPVSILNSHLNVGHGKNLRFSYNGALNFEMLHSGASDLIGMYDAVNNQYLMQWNQGGPVEVRNSDFLIPQSSTYIKGFSTNNDVTFLEMREDGTGPRKAEISAPSGGSYHRRDLSFGLNTTTDYTTDSITEYLRISNTGPVAVKNANLNVFDGVFQTGRINLGVSGDSFPQVAWRDSSSTLHWNMYMAASDTTSLLIQDQANSTEKFRINQGGSVDIMNSDLNENGKQVHGGKAIPVSVTHANWADGLSNEEIHRVYVPSGKQLEVHALDIQMKGGGSLSSLSVNVYDATNATQLASTSAGGGMPTGDPLATSGDGSIVTVRLSNSSGNSQTASVNASLYMI